jgi:hypothetical protein
VEHSKGHAKGKVYSYKYLRLKNRDLANNLIMHLKLLEKQEQTESKTSRQREITKIKAEINKIETKQTIQRINETKNLVL